MARSRIPKTMTVKELIETLEDFDGNSLVFFAYDYGDYWRTTVASSISSVDEEELEYSDYHKMMKIADRDEDEDEEDEDEEEEIDDRPTFVVIS